MKRILLFIGFVLALSCAPVQSQTTVTFQATTGMPAPSLSGTGAPATATPVAYTCNVQLLNIEYLQLDAPQGQRLWLCDNVTGSPAWDHFIPPTNVGSNVSQTGLTGALTSQTVCDTSSTCPVGWSLLDVYIRPISAGTVGTVSSSANWTDMVGAITGFSLPGSCNNLSLLTLVPGTCEIFYYHAANTTVTVSTSVGTLLGSPQYSFFATNTYLHP